MEKTGILMKRKPLQVQPDLQGKVFPQAPEIEEVVLGSLMLENQAITEVINKLSSGSFYKPAHQAIFEAILKLHDRNEPVDILTVANQLKSDGKLDFVGGALFITQLTSRIASSANIGIHASILQQKQLQRDIIHVCSKALNNAFEDGVDAFDLLDQTDLEFTRLTENSLSGSSMNHILFPIQKAIEAAKKREKLAKEGKSLGVTTGVKMLNNITNGWQNSDLIVLAARPGMGKTAIMLHNALAASMSGIPVAIFSLEMSDVNLADRLLIAVSGVDSNNFRSGTMAIPEWKHIIESTTIITQLPIYVDSGAVCTMRYIKAQSRILQKKGKCGIIMIDYLQLVDLTTSKTNRNREQEVAEASRQAKILAKELDVPVILLCQLSRKVEDRPDRKPMLSDLRESGAIEQDADLVVFIYRPEYYGYHEDGSGNSLKGYGELIIAKHRNGRLETVPFGYNESMTLITDFE